MRILLVQDHVGILTYHTQVLRKAGHTVRAFRDGDVAAKVFNVTTFDLVLSDLWHPGLEGHKLIKHIFKRHPKQVVGVIWCNPNMEEKVDVPRLDSFDASDLLSFVERITSSARSAQRNMKVYRASGPR